MAANLKDNFFTSRKTNFVVKQKERSSTIVALFCFFIIRLRKEYDSSDFSICMQATYMCPLSIQTFAVYRGHQKRPYGRPPSCRIYNVVSQIYQKALSCDMFAEDFRKGGARIGPHRTKTSYGKCGQVVNLDVNRHLSRLISCSSAWGLNTK